MIQTPTLSTTHGSLGTQEERGERLLVLRGWEKRTIRGTDDYDDDGLSIWREVSIWWWYLFRESFSLRYGKMKGNSYSLSNTRSSLMDPFRERMIEGQEGGRDDFWHKKELKEMTEWLIYPVSPYDNGDDRRRRKTSFSSSVNTMNFHLFLLSVKSYQLCYRMDDDDLQQKELTTLRKVSWENSGKRGLCLFQSNVCLYVTWYASPL